MAKDRNPKALPAASTNPIKDLNGDGMLDGKELLAQLEAEEQDGTKHIASEHVHSVLKFAAIGNISNVWEFMLKNKAVGPKELEKAEKALAKALGNLITTKAHNFLEEPNTAADYKKAVAENSDFTPENREFINAGIDDFAAFSNHFKKDFPKGIKVSREEVFFILGHIQPTYAPRPDVARTYDIKSYCEK